MLLHGIHIIANLYQYDFSFYISKNSIIQIINDISEIIKKNQLNIVGKEYFEFGNNNFIIAFLLAESHITIHTRPENNYISPDIFVCNYLNNNTKNAKNIFDQFKELFKNKKENIQIIQR